MLPRTTSSSFHGVKTTFFPDDMKLFKDMQVYAYAMLFQTRPSSFHGVEEPFRLDVMQPFQKHSSWWLGRSPTSPVTAQFISRRRIFFSFWCDADFQQRSNKRLVVLPKTRFSSIHGVESTFRPDGVKLFKNIRILGWVVLPQTRSKSVHSVEKLFRLSVMQPIKNIQVGGWAALPNIPCHGPAHFTALNKVFFLMLCRLSTAFKWTAGRAPPNTVQLKSRFWVNFSSGWR